jgi:hypothetical protein
LTQDLGNTVDPRVPLKPSSSGIVFHRVVDGSHGAARLKLHSVECGSSTLLAELMSVFLSRVGEMLSTYMVLIA